VNLAEVIDVMTRIYERPVSSTINALAMLEAGGLKVVSVDATIGISAGELHARHYDRTASPLSMADCVALATAAELGEQLATSDPPLTAAAFAEGIATLPLPDSQGRRPTS
jgi:predicted nucleic acid-binding protein